MDDLERYITERDKSEPGLSDLVVSAEARVEKEININLNVVDSNILFLDLSSACVGYCIGSWDTQTRSAKITKSGIVKFPKDSDHGFKYNFLTRKILNDWAIYENIGVLVMESYHVNPKNRTGCLVVSEMMGACKCCAYELDPPLAIRTVPPQTWKKVTIGNGRAKKDEIKKGIRVLFPKKIPNKISNPITGNQINTPSDLYDALGLAVYWFKEAGCKHIVLEAIIK